WRISWLRRRINDAGTGRALWRRPPLNSVKRNRVDSSRLLSSQLITIGDSGARDRASAIIASSMTGPANKKNVAIGLMVVWISMPSEAQDRSEARSMVISRYGIVATSQTLASQAGAQILARGGSAMDAAIAANAALGVVEPMSNGMGGDLFAIYWEA